jgi:dihydroorotate dehydrogenase
MEQTLFGMTFRNPVLLAAGPADSGKSCPRWSTWTVWVGS